MARVPGPVQTPAGPAYEGGLLANPDEPIVDQGLGFDLGTLFARRRALGNFGMLAGTAAALAACGAATSSSTTTNAAGSSSGGLIEIPDETAGPYPGDGSNGTDVLEQAGAVRRDITSSIGGGATVTMTLNVLDIAGGGGAYAGAAVYVWHADAQGRYLMYSSGVENETYLRGVQRRQGEVHHDLSRLLRRPLAARALRGEPRRGVHPRSQQGRRDQPAGVPEGLLRDRLRRRVRVPQAARKTCPACR